MNNDDGYILLYRSILTDRVLDDPAPFDKRSAYIDLCLMAAFSERDVKSAGKTVHLGKGQLIVSYRGLASRWKWDKGRVARFLKALEMHGILSIGETPRETASETPRETLLTLINQRFPRFGETPNETPYETPNETTFEIEKETEKDKETENGKERSKEKDKAKEKEKGREKDRVGELKNSSPNPQAAFAECWSAYPKKERRRDAYKAFVKALKDGVTVDEIREGIRRFNEHVRRDHVDRQYIPQGGTWFNQRRWEDDYQLPEEKQSVDLSEVFK